MLGQFNNSRNLNKSQPFGRISPSDLYFRYVENLTQLRQQAERQGNTRVYTALGSLIQRVISR